MTGDPMNPLRDVTLCLLGLSLATSSASFSQERDRSKIPDKYKWNLADLYPSKDAWAAEKEAFTKSLEMVDKLKGTLAQSPQSLLACMSTVSNLSQKFSKLYVYASLSSDLNLNDPQALGMVQDMGQVGAKFSAKVAFVQPEVLKMDRAVIDKFLAAEPKLAVYRHDLDDILRRKSHTGTESEEKIIADAGLMADGPDNIYGVFSNAEFPFPSVTLSDGKKVKLDKAAFNLYRAVPNRDDRKKVFATYFGTLNDFVGTFGTQLYAEVKKDMFYMKARNYKSSLESALDGSNIPVEVYKGLVNNVDANLSTFHRYLKLRKRMMGLDTLHYYDLYAPLVKSVDLTYSYEEAQKLILASLQLLGKDYTTVAERGFTERWVDAYPNDGKRAGAYSQGAAYDVHPYMLLNYNGKYDDMSTLTHEFGHTMHSYLANASQPYPTSQYSIFVAEVASTFNEALLMNYMLKSIKDDNVRLTLLGNALDNMKGTIFRQTQFAEFELRIHELAESGKSLTGEGLNDLYAEITRKYYGHDAGVCVVDDEVKAEWSNVPHFYYNFYVFQYATSFTASSALSEVVLSGDKSALTRYLDLLKAGGSDYPITLLRNAGVDMTTAHPFELTLKRMNRIMDEMEQILNKKK
jgi:oligoendopeptidase F